MKQLVILCSLSMVLHFNLYAVHKPALRQRNHHNPQSPSTSSMHMQQKKGTDNKTKPSALKKECTDCCGGCLDFLTTPIDLLSHIVWETIARYIMVSH